MPPAVHFESPVGLSETLTSATGSCVSLETMTNVQGYRLGRSPGRLELQPNCNKKNGHQKTNDSCLMNLKENSFIFHGHDHPEVKVSFYFIH